MSAGSWAALFFRTSAKDTRESTIAPGNARFHPAAIGRGPGIGDRGSGTGGVGRAYNGDMEQRNGGRGARIAPTGACRRWAVLWRTARRLAAGIALLSAVPGFAADAPLLVQMLPGGAFKVWRSEGRSPVTEEELMALEASARPGGGETLATAAGPGRADETPQGIVVYLPRLRDDGALLIDRDACGHIKVWHAEGMSRFGEDQLTEFMMSALPDGGRRIRMGDRFAKAYLTRLGVVVVLWPAAGP